jgi:RNA polymerase sigma factor (sigma-70 family)
MRMITQDRPIPEDAFGDLLERVEPRVKSLLAAYRIPPQDAEDLLQQALLALLYSWDTVREPEHWMIGTLRRQCLLYWRRHRRRIYSAVDSTLLELLSQPVSPSQVREEMLTDLSGLIDRLPPRCRSLLDLRFRLGYEPGEVASLMGYRLSSIAKVTNRCLAALSRQLFLAPLVDRTGSAGER